MFETATHRQTAISAAAAILAREDAVFLKVETSGLNGIAEVLEIAIVHAASGDVILNTLVKPTRRYSLNDKLKHGLTFDNLVDQQPITAFDIEGMLNGKRVIVYGKDFALKMLRQSYAAHSVEFAPNCLWHCVMTLFGAFMGVHAQFGDGWKWWKFDDALEAMHINNTRRNHRALEEAKSIGFLLWTISTSTTPEKPHSSRWALNDELASAPADATRPPLKRPVLNLDDDDDDVIKDDLTNAKQ